MVEAGSDVVFRWTINDKQSLTFQNVVFNVIYQSAAVFKLSVGGRGGGEGKGWGGGVRGREGMGRGGDAAGVWGGDRQGRGEGRGWGGA